MRLAALALAACLALAPADAGASAGAPAAAAVVASPPGVLFVYVRDDCPHCAAAEEFLAALAERRPGLRIVYRAVDADPSARDELSRLFEATGRWPPGVPTFLIDGRVLVGFDDAANTGPDLLALLGDLPQPADRLDTALFGTLSAARLGLPLFTVAVGLLDGFNPCAMWVLLFLLSLLVHMHDRRRMALVAGTFVLVSGAVYYAFLAAWLNVFLLMSMSAALRWTLGAAAIAIGAIRVKDFVAPGRGLSLSIPAAARPGLYARVRGVLRAETIPAALLGVAALAVVVNAVELLCTAGLPALYTAVLSQHELPPLARYGYLGLYITAYVADDSLMVAAAVLALTSGKLSERAGRGLELLSGVVMLALGAVMILRPRWLM
jgi:glutaredoxin